MDDSMEEFINNLSKVDENQVQLVEYKESLFKKIIVKLKKYLKFIIRKNKK